MKKRRIRELRGYKYDTVDMMSFAVDLPDCKGNKYTSIKDGFLYYRPHYAWDGSSIPLKRFIPKRLYDFDKYCKISSLVHDGICQLIREYSLDRKYKEYADELYRQMLIKERMAIWEEKQKRQTFKKRQRYEIKVKKWADARYWFLRKFPNKGITKEKNPRGKIIEI